MPDFVITKREYIFDDIKKSDCVLGCVEMKYYDADVIKPARLNSTAQSKGYLETYSKVIYTNGWFWKFYDGSHESIEINFRTNSM